MESKDDRDVKARIQDILRDAIPAKRDRTPSDARSTGGFPHIVGNHNLVVVQYDSRLVACPGWWCRSKTLMLVIGSIVIVSLGYLAYRFLT